MIPALWVAVTGQASGVGPGDSLVMLGKEHACGGMLLPIPPFRNDGWLPVGHHAASWEELGVRFGGAVGTRRMFLTNKLLELRDTLRLLGVTGYLLLNGSSISTKPEPEDFDVLLVGPLDIQAMKDVNPRLERLLDAEMAENVGGYSLFYLPSDSPALELLSTFWDLSKEGVAKGIIKVEL